MIIEIPDENSVIKWKNSDNDEWKSAEISDLINAYEERPQGELISRDALKEEFNLIASKSATGELSSIPIKHIKQIIDNATPVDISKEVWNKSNELLNKRLSYLGRRRGKWVKHALGYSCSECDGCPPFYPNDKENLSDFCQNCGADMRGKEE